MKRNKAREKRLLAGMLMAVLATGNMPYRMSDVPLTKASDLTNQWKKKELVQEKIENTKDAQLLDADSEEAFEPVSGKCGENLSWTIDKDGVFTISGNGVMDVGGAVVEKTESGYSFHSVLLPWDEYKSHIKKIIVKEGVTTIVDGAFMNCSELTQVQLPEGLTRIGTYAFEECGILAAINFPSTLRELGEDTFAYCNSLTEVVLGDSVESMGKSCFSCCTGLKRVVLGKNLSNIPERAFQTCSSLQSVTIPEGVKTLDKCVFYGNHLSYDMPENLKETVFIPDSVTQMGESCFAQSGIVCLHVGSGLKKWEKQFSNYSNIQLVQFTGDAPEFVEDAFSRQTLVVRYPEGNPTWTASVLQDYGGNVTWESFTLDEYAGEGMCGEETTWTLAWDGTLTISGQGAMEDYSYSNVPWYNLRSMVKKIVIGDQVTRIGKNAFCVCAETEEISFGSSLEEIGQEAFSGCNQIKELKLPESLLRLEPGAFSYLQELTSIVLPGQVQQIGTNCFAYCKKLENVQLNEDLLSLGTHAFRECERLEKISIPASVKEVSERAFEDCSKLHTVEVAARNEKYLSVDGVVYDKEGKNVILIPEGKTSITFPATLENVLRERLKGLLNLQEIKVDPGNNYMMAKDNILYDIGQTKVICAATNLLSVKLPESVTEIGNNAFEGCSMLAEITFPNTLQTIGVAAFSSCRSLYRIEIPESVTTINSRAFVNCTNLRDICFYGEVPEVLNSHIFQNVEADVWYTDNKVTENVQYNYGSELRWKLCSDRSDLLQKQQESKLVAQPMEVGKVYTLPEGLVQYNSLDLGVKQYASQQQNGMYFLQEGCLKFLSYAEGKVEVVYAFPTDAVYHMERGMLYALSEHTVVCYDLEQQQLVKGVTLNGAESVCAVGVDAAGLVYTCEVNVDRYNLCLYSAEGVQLDCCAISDQIYNFCGFDSTNGNFYYEGRTNYYSWGFDHYGRSLLAANQKDGKLSILNVTSSFLESGLISRVVEGLEYLCQEYYMEHAQGGELLADKYLISTSAMMGRVLVYETDPADITSFKVRLNVERQVKDELGKNTFADHASIGVRAAAFPERDSVVIYQTGKQLCEYDLKTGQIRSQVKTAHNVFNVQKYGDTLALVEKEDGNYYLELVDFSAPTQITINGKQDMFVGTAQELSVSSGKPLSVQVEYKSSDEKVVTVTKSGRLAAWKPGTAVITANVPGTTLTSSLTITVAERAHAESEVRTKLFGEETDNSGANNYQTWSKPMSSYLYEREDGFTRVEYKKDYVLVEEYDRRQILLKSRKLSMELSIFGGFYAGKDANYLVFGQKNANQDDSKEIMRVVKYSKDWVRLGQSSVYGANTYIPFDAGCLRMAETGNKLYVYTCHEMYGEVHHQSNMTYVIDQDTMELLDSYFEVMNIAQAGYVSHSFNQFIQTDDTYVYRVDHGDASPRAVSITRCQKDDPITNVRYTTPVDIQGGHGDNRTKLSVGGFALSSENCLIVGNSVDQSDYDIWSKASQRNIFVSVTGKDLLKSEMHWLTDYAEESGVTVRTPQLVALNEEQFLVLWEEYTQKDWMTVVKAALLNGDGIQVGKTATGYLELSDCQPILRADGLVSWYVGEEGATWFYQVDPFHLENLTKVAPLKTPVPTATVKPAETEKPVGPLKTLVPTATVKPAETEKPVDTVKPADTEKPAETIKPTDVVATNSPAEEKPLKTGPKMNTKIKASSGEKYKVTKVGKESQMGNVEYLAPKNTSVTTVKIPEKIKVDGIEYKVTSIASNTFKKNKKVKSVTIGNNVSKIGSQAFYQCKNLKTVEIGSGVKNIDKKAFNSCGNLKTINIKSKKLTTSSVSANAFSKLHKNVIVNVPKSKLSQYKTLLKKKGIAGKKQKIKVL